MKNKIFSLMALGIVFLLVLTSLASATLTFSDKTLSKTVGSHTLTITTDSVSNEAIVINSISPITDSDDDHTITLSLDKDIINSTTPVTLTYTVEEGFNFEDKEWSVSINGELIYFEDIPMPSGDIYADAEDLSIEIDDLSVENGYGDDTDWYPLDEITAKIYVENTGNDEIKSIIVQWGLYDEDESKWIVSGKESKFSLDNGDDKTLTVSFQLDNLNKINVDSENYKFYAWATGENDETEEKTSAYYSDTIDMQFSDDFVILNNIQITETSSCGEELHITAEVVNVGEDDQENIYVVIYNKELGINKEVSIGDIDSLDDSELDTIITLPEDASEKTYSLGIYVYDENDEVYESEDNEESKYVVSFSLSGCSTAPSVSVSANLESEAKAGQEITIRATIINSGASKETFTIDATDYSEWAALSSIDKKTVELDAGNAKDVIIKLNINKDVSGDKTFNVLVTSNGKVLSQPVVVSVEKATSFPNITGFFTSLGGDNWYLWGIGALNVILVLAIIIVAVRVARKK